MNPRRAFPALLALALLAAWSVAACDAPQATPGPVGPTATANSQATISPEETATPAPATSTPTASPTRGSRIYLPYESEANGFRIKYPAEWDVAQRASAPGTITFVAPLQDEGDTFRENVTVVVQRVPAGTTTLDEFTETALAQGQEYIPQFTVQESMPTTLGGNPAQQVVYTGVQGDRDLRWLQLWTLAGDQVYILTYTAEEFEFNAFRSVVQQMIRSMEIR